MTLPSRKFLLRFDDPQINVPALKTEAQYLDLYQPFYDSRRRTTSTGWYKKDCDDKYEFGTKVLTDYQQMFPELHMKARFYRQEPGHPVGFHTDIDTLCSFNFLLQGNIDPVLFKDEAGQYQYRYYFALLNVQELHAVPSPTVNRYLFKISVYNRTYEEVASVLPARLSSRQAKPQQVFHESLLKVPPSQNGGVGDQVLA